MRARLWRYRRTLTSYASRRASLWWCAPLIALFVTSLPLNAHAQTVRKKLIEYGWDVPNPAFVREHVTEMEKRPFDGLVIRLKVPTNVFQHKEIPAASLAQDEADLKATRFTRFKENFLIVWAAADKGWDWFDDRD